MKFDELMQAYAKRLKIDDDLNEDGSMDITYGGEITLHFHMKGHQQLIMTALLDTEGKVSSEYDLQYFMRLHLSRVKIEDSILAVDPESNELVLYEAVNISTIALKEFESRVGLFLNAVRFWREQMATKDEKKMSSEENAMRFFP